MLVVDDEPAIHVALAQTLKSCPYRVLFAHSGREALELLACHDIQIVMSDEAMPDMKGVELCARVRVLSPATVCIMLSGCFDTASLIRAINDAGVYKFISKPWDEQQLRACIADAFVFRDRMVRFAVAADSTGLAGDIRHDYEPGPAPARSLDAVCDSA